MLSGVRRGFRGLFYVATGRDRSLLHRFRIAAAVAWQAFRCPVEEPIVILKYISSPVVPDYRFTWTQLDWWNDTTFNEFLTRFGEREGFNSQRHWTLYQLLRLTANLPGDTAECGVFQGASSYLMATANRQRGAGFLHHGFDSFEGLSAPTDRDGRHWVKGDLTSSLEIARRNLSSCGEAVRLYQGWIPTRFGEVADRAFRLVHIDVDLHRPTVDSMTFFYPRMVQGGIIICDDYAFSTCPGATSGVDEFLADKPEKMLLLPGGGGFLIKGVETGGQHLRTLDHPADVMVASTSTAD